MLLKICPSRYVGFATNSRIGDPIEVVGPVIALAAASGSYITGQVVYIDGGITASQ